MKKCSWLCLLFLSVFLWGNPANGEPSAGLAIEPGGYDFGILGTGSTSGPAIFTVSNLGSAEITLTQIAVSKRSAYSVDVEGGSRPCGKGAPTLAAQESCTVAVRFHPFSTGVINGALEIGSDAADSSEVNATLTGFGVACGC